MVERRLARCFFALWAALAACAAAPREPRTIEEWLARAALPLAQREETFARMVDIVRDARVVALGEATHGQREAFEFKRELTMHLVREAGFRVVAYEASSASARACDDYVAGRSDDLERAVEGLGMLIWQVEENAALLRDLRDWNRTASESERVRFIGVDVQDPGAAAQRIEELLGDTAGDRGERLRAWADSIGGAIQARWTGDSSAYTALDETFGELNRSIVETHALANDARSELALRLRELHRALRMHHSAGGRDRAMAEMLLEQLEGSSERAVVWAHNAHVTRGPLRSLASEELGMGGVVAARIGAAYYALGFAFGEGEFQANAPNSDGRWGFRRYRVSAAPEGGLDALLARACEGDYIVDLRAAPRDGAIAAWLEQGHGQRWFGGYNVSDDCDAHARNASALLPTVPRVDFDGLVFFARTQAARPRDPTRLIDATHSR